MRDDDAKTIGQFLGLLSGRGIYDVAIVEHELPAFGFGYIRANDSITYQGRSIKLFSSTPEQMARSINDDPNGGLLTGEPQSGRLIDAQKLSAVIYRLMFEGQSAPSEAFYGRARGFNANVEAIVAFEKAQ